MVWLMPSSSPAAHVWGLLQAQDTSKAVSQLPRSLAQWLPATVQRSTIQSLPPSRLLHVLQRHFPPQQSAQLKAVQQRSHGYAESASGNPQIAPYGGVSCSLKQQQQEQLLVGQQKHPGGRKAAKVAGAFLRERHASSKPLIPAGRLPAAPRHPQTAGSSVASAQRGKPVAKGKTKARARSVSPNSQYHFSCTSSVPDHGSSWYGDATSVASQDWPKPAQDQHRSDRGKDAAQWPFQLLSGHAAEGPCPVHTTYVVPNQHQPADGFPVIHEHESQGRQHDQEEQVKQPSAQDNNRQQHGMLDHDFAHTGTTLRKPAAGGVVHRLC